ncbi:MAG: hypothetical protein HXY28_02970 [Hydrogenophilaceae bacterium]|nr:hypothetical protein [Hydrogenophilaceae bacterium]
MQAQKIIEAIYINKNNQLLRNWPFSEFMRRKNGLAICAVQRIFNLSGVSRRRPPYRAFPPYLTQTPVLGPGFSLFGAPGP